MGLATSICNFKKRTDSCHAHTRITQAKTQGNHEKFLLKKLHFQQIADLFPCKYLGRGLYGTTLQVIVKSQQLQQGKCRPHKYAEKIVLTQNLRENYILYEPQVIDRIMMDPLIKKHIVKVHAWSVSKQQQKLYLIMDLMDKGDLYFHLCKLSGKNGRYFPQIAIKRVAYQILVLLQRIHKYGLIFRNLRTQNVFIKSKQSAGQSLAVSDFFFAINDNICDTYFGAAQYAPPEVFDFQSRQRNDNTVYNPKVGNQLNLVETVQSGAAFEKYLRLIASKQPSPQDNKNTNIEIKSQIDMINEKSIVSKRQLKRADSKTFRQGFQQSSTSIRQENRDRTRKTSIHNLQVPQSLNKNALSQDRTNLVVASKLNKDNSTPDLKRSMQLNLKKDPSKQLQSSQNLVSDSINNKNLKVMQSLPQQHQLGKQKKGSKFQNQDKNIEQIDSNQGQQQQNNSLISNQYKTSDSSIDIWMLGIMLYQLIYGRTPFEKNKVQQGDILSKQQNRTQASKRIPHIQQRIRCMPLSQIWTSFKNQTIDSSQKLPASPIVSKEQISFIQLLLTRDVDTRPTIPQLLQHEYFSKSQVSLDLDSSLVELIYSQENAVNQFKNDRSSYWYQIKHYLKNKDNGLMASRNTLKVIKNFRNDRNSKMRKGKISQRLFQHEMSDNEGNEQVCQSNIQIHLPSTIVSLVKGNSTGIPLDSLRGK